MTTTTWQGSALEELPATQCWRLLESQEVGRIAYADAGGPIVLPLNYVTRRHAIWFRTASYSQLAVHLPDQLVGFQVDHHDVRAQSGWSVLVRGRARHVLGSADQPHPSPWPEGTRTMVFRIETTVVSGRILHPSS